MNEHEDPTTGRDRTTPVDGTPPPGTTTPLAEDVGARGDTLDFFGASPPPTLPAPSTPPPAADTVEATPSTVPTPTGPAAGPDAGTGTAAPGPARARRGVRIRTVVFGLVMLVISVTSLVAVLTAIDVEGEVVGLGLLIGAGAALFLGGLSAAVRDVRRGGTRFTS
jgi:hypothetical protein